MLKFKVSENENRQRVDSFLAKRIKELSRSFINQLCGDGNVLVNTSVVKPGHKLKTDDNVTVNFNLNLLKNVPKINLPVIYEDDNCIVIDKPSGVLTHSKGSYNPEATVASFIREHVSNAKTDAVWWSGNRAGIVHRLDRFTSGVIICAKNVVAMSWLQKQFSTRNVKKTYLAVINGHIEPEAAIIDMPIERNPKKPQTFRVGPNGKPAITEYRTVQKNDEYSLIELRPKTGRTHQLRVHLQKLGYPILGDLLYSGVPANRLFLHAAELEITLPDKSRKVFKSKLPSAFTAILK